LFVGGVTEHLRPMDSVWEMRFVSIFMQKGSEETGVMADIELLLYLWLAESLHHTLFYRTCLYSTPFIFDGILLLKTPCKW